MSGYAVTDPSTGETVCEYETIGDTELDRTIASTHAAYVNWSRITTAQQRSTLIKRVAELHLAQKGRDTEAEPYLWLAADNGDKFALQAITELDDERS